MAVAKDFVGVWVSSLPWDSDDYLIKYEISLAGESFNVTAVDMQDGERIEIADVTFDGEGLQFTSYVASTRRRGLNRFRLLDRDRVEAEFTFTVVEHLKRPERDDSTGS